MGLWFDEIDSGRWNRFVATGPTGSGKTLTAFIVPILYHLFEVGETVLCGVPSLDMVTDKWTLEILPVIQASRFAELLPTKGAGSRGGDPTSVTFRNGATLRFMSGGGGDKARAGFHCRILVVTETDGFDEAGGTSREADKLTQLERRTSSYGDRARIYLECTVSTEAGRTWREFSDGTASKIIVRCPHCRRGVTPEREHLVGWRDSVDVLAAAENARVVCPSCGQVWAEEDRHAANHDCRLLHRQQKLADDDRIEGDPPRTTTLGFRWTAVNNLLVKIGHVAQEEWRASKEPDPENAEKKMRQFVWALPHLPDKVDLTALQARAIAARTGDWPRGVVPPDSLGLTVGVDLGSRLCHWTAIAWRPGATPHVTDHGRWEVAIEAATSIEIAVLTALRRFRDEVICEGWPVGQAGSKTTMRPTLSYFDCGWQQGVVLAFCKESGPGFLATKGFGSNLLIGNERTTGTKVIAVGDGYELVRLPDGREMIDVKADVWKAFVHARLKTPVGQAGGMTLFVPGIGDPNAHVSFANHLVAERQVEEFKPGVGLVTRYEKLNRNNHWLDSTSMACVAGHTIGVKLFEPPQKPPSKQPRPKPDRPDWMPDRPDDLLNR